MVESLHFIIKKPEPATKKFPEPVKKGPAPQHWWWGGGIILSPHLSYLINEWLERVHG